MQQLRRALAAGAAFAALAWAGAAGAEEAQTTAPPDTPADQLPTEEAVGEDGLGAAAPEPEPAPPPASSPRTFGSPGDAILAGKLIFEARARYEHVDQKRTPVMTKAGEAFTLRTRLGWETGDWHGLKGLVEFEDVRQIGPEHYQVQVPGNPPPPLNGADKVRFPIINDPDVTELNRLQLTWTPSAAAQATVGRQRILIEDQRFIGNVGWRQDEQTFDAARADVAFGRFKATYAYVIHVNRILAEARDWDSDSHLFTATWSQAEQLRVSAFAYLLDFGNSPINASQTYGVKASGKAWVGLFQLAYNATYANQRDYNGNTPDFDLDYWGGDVAGTFDIWTAKASYEVLEGNGARGFTTPLATTHAFQGWADAFVSPGGNKSFVDGIEDLNFTLNAKPRWRWPYLFNIDVLVRWHDFQAERTGAHLGHEWDAQIQAAINPRLSAALKYADFERDDSPVLPGRAAPPASRTKVWFTLEYKL